VQHSNAEVNYLVMGLIIAFTAIAVVNTLAMSVSDRSREFALLRLVGTTRRQVMSMLLIESALVVLIAAVLGSGIALAVLTAFSAGMTGGSGPSVAPWTYLGVLGLAGLLATVATVVPGRVALTGRSSDIIASAM
jgi:putative ABC transport system permease protein